MHRRLRTVVPALAAIAALLTGCSGGTEVSERSESAPRPASSDGSGPTSSNAPSTTEGGDPEPASQDGPLCDAAQRIRDLDDQSNAIMNDVMSAMVSDPSAAMDEFAGAMSELEPLIGELASAYDDLSNAAPDHSDDVGLVKDFTLSLMERLSVLDSPEDFAELESQFDQNSAMAAGAATLEIDAVTREQCGISIAG